MSAAVSAEQREASDGAQAPGAGRPKVLYVMGSGHSGSTILGVALGNCEGVFYAGELDTWLLRGGVPALGGSERVHFWDRVRAGVSSAEGMFGDEAKRHLERSLAAFRVHRWPRRRRLRSRYARFNAELYRAIAGAANATLIVDSSHFPLRARELQRLRDIDLYLLFLVRDPQGVVASFNLHVGRHDPLRRLARVLETNADLWMTHLLSTFVFLRQPRARRMLVRHEEFLADPEGAMGAILERVGCAAQPPELSALRTGFPFFGNRLLKTDVVSLKRRTVRPRRVSHLTALLQLPWAAAFARLR
jgi:hypothetical protein